MSVALIATSGPYADAATLWNHPSPHTPPLSFMTTQAIPTPVEVMPHTPGAIGQGIRQTVGGFGPLVRSQSRPKMTTNFVYSIGQWVFAFLGNEAHRRRASEILLAPVLDLPFVVASFFSFRAKQWYIRQHVKPADSTLTDDEYAAGLHRGLLLVQIFTTVLAFVSLCVGLAHSDVSFELVYWVGGGLLTGLIGGHLSWNLVPDNPALTMGSFEPGASITPEIAKQAMANERRLPVFATLEELESLESSLIDLVGTLPESIRIHRKFTDPYRALARTIEAMKPSAKRGTLTNGHLLTLTRQIVDFQRRFKTRTDWMDIIEEGEGGKDKFGDAQSKVLRDSIPLFGRAVSSLVLKDPLGRLMITTGWIHPDGRLYLMTASPYILSNPQSPQDRVDPRRVVNRGQFIGYDKSRQYQESRPMELFTVERAVDGDTEIPFDPSESSAFLALQSIATDNTSFALNAVSNGASVVVVVPDLQAKMAFANKYLDTTDPEDVGFVTIVEGNLRDEALQRYLTRLQYDFYFFEQSIVSIRQRGGLVLGILAGLLILSIGGWWGVGVLNEIIRNHPKVWVSLLSVFPVLMMAFPSPAPSGKTVEWLPVSTSKVRNPGLSLDANEVLLLKQVLLARAPNSTAEGLLQNSGASLPVQKKIRRVATYLLFILRSGSLNFQRLSGTSGVHSALRLVREHSSKFHFATRPELLNAHIQRSFTVNSMIIKNFWDGLVNQYVSGDLKNALRPTPSRAKPTVTHPLSVDAALQKTADSESELQTRHTGARPRRSKPSAKFTLQFDSAFNNFLNAFERNSMVRRAIQRTLRPVMQDQARGHLLKELRHLLSLLLAHRNVHAYENGQWQVGGMVYHRWQGFGSVMGSLSAAGDRVIVTVQFLQGVQDVFWDQITPLCLDRFDWEDVPNKDEAARNTRMESGLRPGSHLLNSGFGFLENMPKDRWVWGLILLGVGLWLGYEWTLLPEWVLALSNPLDVFHQAVVPSLIAIDSSGARPRFRTERVAKLEETLNQHPELLEKKSLRAIAREHGVSSMTASRLAASLGILSPGKLSFINGQRLRDWLRTLPNLKLIDEKLEFIAESFGLDHMSVIHALDDVGLLTVGQWRQRTQRLNRKLKKGIPLNNADREFQRLNRQLTQSA